MRPLTCVLCGAHADHAVDPYCDECRGRLDRAAAGDVDPVEQGVAMDIIEWLSRNGAGSPAMVRDTLGREYARIRLDERRAIVKALTRMSGQLQRAPQCQLVLQRAAAAIERGDYRR